jgi:soluble lytic murein transglycosylase-like protein
MLNHTGHPSETLPRWAVRASRTGVALTFVVGFTLASLPSPVSAQIYSWRDANGRLVLSNTPRSGAGEVVKSYPAPGSPASAQEVPLTSRTARERASMYEGLIIEQARLNDIRPDLVRAVVRTESAFNPYAISSKGAQGLMQLMPSTANLFGVKNPYNPEENVRAGVAYLRQLLDRYDNNEQLALAAYNAGPNAVDKYGQTIPPYRETRNYVALISGMTSQPVARHSGAIYKVTEIVNGRESVRYTDQRPATGRYQIVGGR